MSKKKKHKKSDKNYTLEKLVLITALLELIDKVMEVGRILTAEAAAILNVSPQFVRIAMQKGKLPIGTAVRMSSIWTYHISEKLLHEYSGKDIEWELERIRGKE